MGNDGSVVFMDGAGPVFTIPVGLAWDSGNRHGGQGEMPLGASSSPVKFLLEENGSVLVVRPDERWLRDPLREYPVTIDPTIEIGRGSYNLISNRVAVSSQSGQLVNGSFEGGMTGWTAWHGGGTTNSIVYENASISKDGSKYLSANTNFQGGSVYQDVNVSVPAGVPVTISAWLRAETPTANAALCGWVGWDHLDSSCSSIALTSTEWTRVDVVVESLFQNYVVRVQLYLANIGTVSMDTVSMVVGNTALKNGSFERASTGWQAWDASTAFSLQTNGGLAHDGQNYLLTSASTANGSFYQDFDIATASGQPVSVSGWFRAQNGPVYAAFCAWQLNGPQTAWEPTCSPVQATSAGWTRVQVVAQTTTVKTKIRVQVYIGNTNAGLMADTISAYRTGDVSEQGSFILPSPQIAVTYAGEGLFGTWFGPTQYSRLRFGLDPSMTGSTVNSAVLHTFVRNCDHLAPNYSQLPWYSNPIHVRRMVSDFDQNPEAVTDDRTSFVAGPQTYADVDVTDYVRSWVNDPASNYGVRLDMGQIPGGNSGYCRFASNSNEFAGDLNKTTYLEVTYNESPVANKRYHPVTAPARILDSRGTAFAATRTVSVTGGSTGIPLKVSAVALNVTAVEVTGTGYLSVHPTGVGSPSSNSNWVPGQYAVSNHVIVGIGQNGTITVDVPTGTAQLIVETVGWFDTGNSSTTAGGMRYTPIDAVMAFDSRSGPALTAGQMQSVQIAGRGGLPAAGIGAVAVNITGISQNGLGHVYAWASTEPEPPALTNLFLGATGDTRAGFAVVKVGSNGQINVKTAVAAHVLVSVVGWFSTSPTTGAGMQPINPQRVADTRSTTGPLSDLDIAVSDGAGVGSVIMNVTLTNVSAAGYASVYTPGGSSSGPSSLNFNAGATVANLTIARVSGDGKVHIRVFGATANIIVDVLGYTATADNVSITGANSLRNGSFELGTSTTADSWVANTTCGDLPNQVNFARITSGVNAAGGADDGASYARINATAVGATGSICQPVAHTPATGEEYVLTFRTRTSPGQTTGRGFVELWELGSALPGIQTPVSANANKPFLATAAWHEEKITLCATNTNGYAVEPKIYPYTTTPFDVDDVRLVIAQAARCVLNPGVDYGADLSTKPHAALSNLGDGGFQAGAANWGVCNAPTSPYLSPLSGVVRPVGGVTIQARPAAAGSWGPHMAVTADRVGYGENIACYNFGAAPPTNGGAHTFSAWVRSADNTNFPARLTVSGVIHMFNYSCGYDCGSTGASPISEPFVATQLWQKITVKWWPPTTYPFTYTLPGLFEAQVVPLQVGKTCSWMKRKRLEL